MTEQRYLDKLWTLASVAHSKAFKAELAGRDTRGHLHVFCVLGQEYDTVIKRMK